MLTFLLLFLMSTVSDARGTGASLLEGKSQIHGAYNKCSSFTHFKETL